MKNILKYTLLLGMPAVALSSCNDFLDTMPDSRTTLDTDDKIEGMLVSAYNDHDYCLVNEMQSDNSDEFDFIPSSGPWFEDTFAWKPETESRNESLSKFWASGYKAIASANEAIAAIGEPQNLKQSQMLGEALMCRAYHHFMLVNMFSREYSQETLDRLGIPYMKHAETTLMPKYERGTLKETYELIEKDLEEGLQLVSDDYYTVPKYHFNVKAAYAFAARFYLYTEQWEKAVDAATECLGPQPKTMLRDWDNPVMNQNITTSTLEYISPQANANLLLQPTFAINGLLWGNSGSYGRINHTAFVALTEDVRAQNIWGDHNALKIVPRVYQSANNNKVVIWKVPNLFEYTDIVAGNGYRHTCTAILTSDECLLNRAEALIMLKKYDEACADLNLWMHNCTKSTLTLTPSNIQSFYNGVRYSYEYTTDKSKEQNKLDLITGTIKKHLNPHFAIDAEGSVQECMLQCVLGFKRVETMHDGLRWFDIRRYRIVIPRRIINQAGKPVAEFNGMDIDDEGRWLTVDDERRAHQLPADVITAGLTPNPENPKNENAD